MILSNLEKAFPDLPIREKNILKNKYYNTLTRYILESMDIYINKSFAKEGAVQYQNASILEEGNDHKVTIVLSGHLGNWEWTSMLLPLHVKSDVYAIYKPLANKALDYIVLNKRSRYGLKLLSMDDTGLKVLRNRSKAIYLFVADQSPANSSNGKWVDFLSCPTLFYTGAELLAQKANARVYYQWMDLHPEKYSVRYIPMESTNITQKYAELLEQNIRAYPYAWLWSHRRWKHNRPQ